MRGISPFETVVRGYRDVSPAERALFGITATFAATIGASRAGNYIRERHRMAPRARSWTRKAYHAPGQEEMRVHHFTPGIAILLAVGGAAILTREDGREWRFSLPFGVGAGLTLDEIALLVELDNPYWESEKFAVAQALMGALAAAALAGRFYLRGATLPRPAESESEAGSPSPASGYTERVRTASR
jgi:hypothetical protein